MSFVKSQSKSAFQPRSLSPQRNGEPRIRSRTVAYWLRNSASAQRVLTLALRFLLSLRTWGNPASVAVLFHWSMISLYGVFSQGGVGGLSADTLALARVGVVVVVVVVEEEEEEGERFSIGSRTDSDRFPYGFRSGSVRIS